MSQVVRTAVPADALPGDSVVALYFIDQRPLAGPAALLDWRLDGSLTRMLLDDAIQGRAGEHVVFQGNGKLAADWVIFVGGGKWHGLCAETHAALVRHMLEVASRAGFKEVSLALAPHEEVDCELLGQQVTEAMQRGGAGISSCRYACSEQVSA
jgi:hypothetical protein